MKGLIGRTDYSRNKVSGVSDFRDYLLGIYKKIDGYTVTFEWTGTNRKIYDSGTLPATTEVESSVRDQRTNFMISKTF